MTIEQFDPCPNCKDIVRPCQCTKNICRSCSGPVGNVTFTVCGDCWDKQFEEKDSKILAKEFEEKAFKLINQYVKSGLQKPDLIEKLEWIVGSCKMS